MYPLRAIKELTNMCIVWDQSQIPIFFNITDTFIDPIFVTTRTLIHAHDSSLFAKCDCFVTFTVKIWLAYFKA